MSVVDPIVERVLKPVPRERTALERLKDRDVEEGTLAKVAQWRHSLAMAEARVVVAKAKLSKAWTEELERELSDAAGAASYCRDWLRDHR